MASPTNILSYLGSLSITCLVMSSSLHVMMPIEALLVNISGFLSRSLGIIKTNDNDRTDTTQKILLCRKDSFVLYLVKSKLVIISLRPKSVAGSVIGP